MLMTTDKQVMHVLEGGRPAGRSAMVRLVAGAMRRGPLLLIAVVFTFACTLTQVALASPPTSTPDSPVGSSHMGLGPHASVPAWARGKRIHFLASVSPRLPSPQSGTLRFKGEAPLLGGTLEKLCNFSACPSVPLLYHEGSGVQHHPKIYAIFWGKNWEKAPGAELKVQLLRMYEGLSGSTAYIGILSQYFDATGGRVSSPSSVTSYIDTGVAAPSSVNDARIREEAGKAISVNTWPQELDNQFVVIPAPGIHSRLTSEEGKALVELTNPLMGTIVLPYLGSAAARRELGRSLPARGGSTAEPRAVFSDPFKDAGMRLTYRTVRVLSAIVRARLTVCSPIPRRSAIRARSQSYSHAWSVSGWSTTRGSVPVRELRTIGR